MSNANIKLIQDVYAAFGRGDIPAVLDAVTPDVTWGVVGREQDVPFAGIRHGRNGAAEFFRLLKETKDLTNFTPQKFVAADDMVLVWGRYDWTMHSSGVAGESEFLHVFTIRDGKICAWRGHQDTARLAQAFHARPATKLAANG